MGRPPSFDSNGMKKGAWSEEEDDKLIDHVLRFGHTNWQMLPRLAGLARSGKSCRLRWVNYLKPGLKRGNFTKQEEDLIIKLHAQIGSKWSEMARQMPGRTDNEIKNQWHAHIKKRLFHNNNNLSVESPNENVDNNNEFGFPPSTPAQEHIHGTDCGLSCQETMQRKCSSISSSASNQPLQENDDGTIYIILR